MGTSRVFWVDLRFFRDQVSSCDCVSKNLAVSSINSTECLDLEIRKTAPKLICFEYDYPDTTSLSVLRRVRRLFPSMPIIMLTEQHSEALAIWALRVRVWDFFIKPLQAQDLVTSIATILIQENSSRDKTPQSSRQRLNLLSNPIPTELRAPPSQKLKTYPAQLFVDAHYHERIREEEVAQLCGMNASTFSRSFKKEHAKTFRDYLINFRISRARELLQNPNASVTDIAYIVGFQDPSYFTRIFRRIVGMSPSRYREVNKIH